MLKCQVVLKFCGCCNPYVDLSRIARHLRAIGERCNSLEIVSLAPRDAEVVVILCGCLRACADKSENKAGKLVTIVVAGESVDGELVPESDLGIIVGQKLAAALNQWKKRCGSCS